MSILLMIEEKGMNHRGLMHAVAYPHGLWIQNV